MKILIYGAGVIGCIYSAKLKNAGFDITLLSRGKKYDNLKKYGIILNNVLTGKRIVSNIKLTRNLNPKDFYNLIIITVRLDQLESVKAYLKQNKVSNAIMFMLNNPEKLQELVHEFPDKKIILGFPGVGGIYQNNQIDYVQIKEQKTTIGTIDGNITNLVTDIKSHLSKAGFTVDISKNMQAWLKIHAVFIACVSAAIIKENGDSVQLGKNRESVQIMVKSIKEGFAACKNMGIRITPANLKIIFMIMPEWFCVWYWQNALRGKTGTLAIAPHANAAKKEMRLL
ncbi:MAG: 2-dehydropantoate 2-reductase N-terminal domain-containing protein, partial [Ferruginibacter sp.]